MRTALVNGRVLLDDGIVEGRAVLVEDGRIAAIVAPGDIPAAFDRHDLDGQLLAPGFIDTQVNGGGGALFNEAPSVEAIATIGAAHRRFGTTGFLPTLISDDVKVMAEAVDAVERAIASGVPGVLGIHIEGPFLNPQRRGIHDAGKIRPLDEAGFATLTGLRSGRTLVTLAPEKTKAGTVRRLVEAGVIVSAGHTNGTYEDALRALGEGMTGFTHLFNAMSPLTVREPGIVGAALDNDTAWCGIIVDGRHVAPATLRVALRCRPHDRLMLVTDAMPTVGQPEKSFRLQGRTISVRDGVCVDDSGTLAGSDLDMATAVRNATEMLGLPLETALAMASRTPAAFLGLDRRLGRIAEGYDADLVALDEGMQVAETWIAGVPLAS
ncbi:MAG: N-acetylglucosamine-6-phosphate deacetylase [Alphaproteobacteria bacterium]|nr:N-acetylglucosamine-6-phosphate deacetylase [Alphaproteobacteria bacterium]